MLRPRIRALSTTLALRNINSPLPTCGTALLSPIGSSLTIQGWASSVRSLSESLVFLTVRDAYGSIQVVVTDSASAHAARALRIESIIRVQGTLQARTTTSDSGGSSSNGTEIAAASIELLSSPSAPLAISLRGDGHITTASGEFDDIDTRLANRHLDLRRSVLSRNLRLRALVSAAVRAEFFRGAGDVSRPFVEVETPTLVRSSPEGAREFLVSTHEGSSNSSSSCCSSSSSSSSGRRFFALAQSPQQHKQLLMVGGIDRYFQIARCYRDESGRVDRQPEFTQIDFELSFAGGDDVMRAAERVVVAAWSAAGKAARGEELDGNLPHYAFKHLSPPLINWELPSLPLPRISYAHAMTTYGSDKPDRRLGLCIADVTGAMAKAAIISNNGGVNKHAAVSTAITVAASLPCPPLHTLPTDTDLTRFTLGSWSARGFVARGLGTVLSRKQFQGLGEGIAKVTSGRAIDILRVEIGGTIRGARAPISGGIAQLGATALTTLITTLEASPGDVIVIGAGEDSLSLLGGLGVARLIVAATCRSVDIPLIPALDCASPPPSRDEPLAGVRLSGREMDEMLHIKTSARGGGGGGGGGGSRIADLFWVHSFPMFEIDAEATGGLRAAHHPFSAPVGGTAGITALSSLLLASSSTSSTTRRTQLLTLCADAYDLVCHGVELGGGSARLSDANLQRAVFEKVLCLSPTTSMKGFSALLAGLDAGAPPHAGAALGLDRLVAMLAGTNAATSLRDVIAFPKSAAGNDLLTGAPCPLD